jgi:hypothetical protein
MIACKICFFISLQPNLETTKMKFRLSVCVGVTIFITLLWACGPSQQQLAGDKFKISEELLAKGDTLNSLLHLDSIPRLYPEARQEALRAVQTSNKIYSSKLLKQRDNLAAAQMVIGSLIKEFNPEKGEFDKYTCYIHNRQGMEKNWSRSFIQVYLNEKGDLSLVSNYYGEQWLNHTSFRIVGDGIAAKTDSIPLDNPGNHRSEFSGAKWEKVTYRGSNADSVIFVIASNSDKKLKSIFKGKTSSYTIWIEEIDKKAIKTAYDLSKALIVKNQSEKMIAELEKKIKS